MPYEVTKRIKGRDYLYRVESVADPRAGRPKQKWIYVGRVVEGSVVDARRRTTGDARARIVAAMLALLERRDLAHLTIDVIVRAAAVSRPTFYRHFASRSALLAATIDSIGTEIEASATLASDSDDLEGERGALRRYLREVVLTLLRRPGLHRAIAASPPAIRELQRKQRAKRIVAVETELTQHLVRVDERYGLHIGNAPLVASAIVSTLNGVFQRVVYERDPDVERIVEGFLTMVDRAVFASATRDDVMPAAG